MAKSERAMDSLEEHKNNPDAIRLIMELYNVDEDIATELWHRFIGTVVKMRAITQQSTEEGS